MLNRWRLLSVLSPETCYDAPDELSLNEFYICFITDYSQKQAPSKFQEYFEENFKLLINLKKLILQRKTES